ncbi:uncharacterized protein B4U80_10445 [Leptotrombidium deliense]|uniref:Uncharacterized protein n=1 Tax=Leptotrombidium deliense TaxID=299467 RepID=A0A443SBE9_9ACAR|nr:uncharacterized protein B4U80_10445 [Leptotrombidium deliense]
MKNNIFTQSLANRISRLFDKSKHEKRSVKKRILVKRNNANNKDKSETDAIANEKEANRKKLNSGKQVITKATASEKTKDKKLKSVVQKAMKKQLHSVALFKDTPKPVNRNKTSSVPKKVSAIAKLNVTTNQKSLNSSKLNAVPLMKRTDGFKKKVNASLNNGKPSKVSDTQVMEELKVIIDKKNTKKPINKRNAESKFSAGLTKRTDTPEESEAKKDEEFRKWLREEYWKNMARVLSVRKRKRNDDNNDDNGEDAIVEEMDENLLVFGKDNNDEYNDTRVTDIEKNDEDYVSLNPLENGEDTENKIEPLVRKRKMKRSVDLYFGDLDEDNVEEEEKFNDVDFKLEKIQSDLINEALQIIKDNGEKSPTNPVRNKIRHRLDAAYDLEDMRHALTDLHKTMRKIEYEPDAEHVETESSFEVLPLNAMSKKSEECPTLNLLTSDCSAIEDVVPRGELREAFIDACNWHEVCYSCGQMYGLMAADCDAGFLEKSRDACNESSSCETAARLIVTPLRQRRVFYKRKIPGVCRQHKCVRDFLTDISNRKR